MYCVRSLSLLFITIATTNLFYTDLVGTISSARIRHDSYQHDCTFCRIHAGEETGAILYEDTDVMVIEKQRPPRSGLSVDCLIIPKKHIRNLKSLDQNNTYDQTILSKMGFVAQKLGLCLSGNGGFRNEINNEFGQGVFHLHMHFKSPNSWIRRLQHPAY